MTRSPQIHYWSSSLFSTESLIRFLPQIMPSCSKIFNSCSKTFVSWRVEIYVSAECIFTKPARFRSRVDLICILDLDNSIGNDNQLHNVMRIFDTRNLMIVLNNLKACKYVHKIYMHLSLYLFIIIIIKKITLFY